MAKKTIKSKVSSRRKIEGYFRRYLRIGPLGLALWRSVEAKHLGNTVLKKPILDIGCGFGEFAIAYNEPIDMGIDNCSKDLYVASKTNMYKNLTLADARDLPFSSNSYASIFSISTLEHIENPDKVLKEAFRVLKPGGVLFLTLETDEVDGATFYRPLFQKIGLAWLRNLTTDMYNDIFHRHTLLPKEDWKAKVEKAGFVIKESRDIISPKVNKMFDILLIFAWPSQLFRPIVGKRVVFRPKIIEDLLVSKFLKYVAEDEKEGTNLLIIAKKPL